MCEQIHVENIGNLCMGENYVSYDLGRH
jgi:hypothetical protein